MPTKKNAAGHDQPYVPAGNPTGGEYADNETGSNRNYKSDKKKDREEMARHPWGYTVPDGKALSLEYREGTHKTPKKRMFDKINYNAPDEYLGVWVNSPNKESKAIVDSISRRIHFKKSKDNSEFVVWDGEIRLDERWFRDDLDGQAPRDAFFHETGHAVDYYRSPYRLVPSNRYSLQIPLSWAYRTEATGKTIYETLNEELTPELCARIAHDFWEEDNKLGSDEYDKRSRLRSLWSDLSDIYEGATLGGRGNFGYGHSPEYWTDSLGQARRGTEFFAECFSARTNSRERYDLIRKYLPNSCKAFDEVYDKLAKGTPPYEEY